MLRPLRQHDLDHLGKGRRNIGADGPQGGQRLGQVLLRDVRSRSPGEGEAPTERVVEGCAEAVDIAPAIAMAAQQVLGSDVLRCPIELLGAVARGIRQLTRQAEIGQLDRPRGGEDDVVRFDVPMHEALAAPGEIERPGDLQCDIHRPVGHQAPAMQDRLLQRAALDVLHGEEEQPGILAHRVRLHDVGVVDGGRGPCLVHEVFDVQLVCPVTVMQDLQRRRTVQ